MKTINSFHLNRCMHKIIKYADEENGRWQGETLEAFCKNSFNCRLLHCLEDNDFISLISADNDVIFAVIVLPEGYTYFSVKQEHISKFLLKSILVPIAVAIITTIITCLITNALTQSIQA